MSRIDIAKKKRADNIICHRRFDAKNSVTLQAVASCIDIKFLLNFHEYILAGNSKGQFTSLARVVLES